MTDNYIRVTTLVKQYSNPFNVQEAAIRVASRRGDLTAAEVLAEWAQLREDAASHGTTFHSRIESFVQDDKFEVPPENKEQFLWYKEFLKDYDVVASEQRLYSHEYQITGAFDLLLRHKTLNHILLLDHKTNKAIKDKGYQKMLYPLCDLDDVNFYHYSLQQALYAILIREQLNLEVHESVIVHVPKGQQPKLYQINLNNMLRYANLILERRLADLRMQKLMNRTRNG